MKVLFDHQAFLMQTHGGVSRCFAELYRNQIKGCQIDISLLESNNGYLKEMGVGKSIGYNYQHFIFPFHWPLKGKMFTAYNMLRGRGSDYHCSPYEYNEAITIQRLKKGDFEREKSFTLCYNKEVLLPNKYLIHIAIHVPNVKYYDRQDTCIFSVYDSGTELLKYNGTDNGFIMFHPEIKEV